jgi:branched-chain amino acid transport system ATP-binding protein
MTQPLLSVRDVNTFYGESHILYGLTFEVFPGEVVGILGRNGVGKTTTLQSILGIPSPRSGEIRLNEEAISDLPTYEIVARGVGWVPQGHRIFPTLTVIENIELALARSRPGRWYTDAV